MDFEIVSAEILKIASRQSGYSLGEILSSSRKKDLVTVRNAVAICLSKIFPGVSLEEVSKAIKRHRTTLNKNLLEKEFKTIFSPTDIVAEKIFEAVGAKYPEVRVEDFFTAKKLLKTAKRFFLVASKFSGCPVRTIKNMRIVGPVSTVRMAIVETLVELFPQVSYHQLSKVVNCDYFFMRNFLNNTFKFFDTAVHKDLKDILKKQYEEEFA